MGWVFKMEEPQKSAPWCVSLSCFGHCGLVLARKGGFCQFVDVIWTGGCWMLSGTGFGDATKPVLSVPSPLMDENPENLRLFVCCLPVK